MTTRLGLTTGEPTGIGPDLAVKIAQHRHDAEIVAIGDPDVLEQRARQLGLPLQLETYDPHRSDGDRPGSRPGILKLWPVSVSTTVQAGKLDPANADYVLETLRMACRGCLDGTFDAMVTAPVHKEVINQANIPFTGHTEFLAELSGGKQPVMMLTTPGLRVALLTTHLPLADVPRHITPQLLDSVVRIIDDSLRQRFGIDEPKITVCGLNPHAGEGGYLGREEVDIITPALTALRRSNIHVQGPLPADTVFTPKILTETDVVLAMYHDQGLPVLKHKGFGNAVNITLGLPIIRTSVDHGTALDLAGTGQADDGSLIAAIEAAQNMVEFASHSDKEQLESVRQPS